MRTLIAAQEMVPLAPFTTLELGGPASQFLQVSSVGEATEVVQWWRALPNSERPALLPLGGGSNLLISDHGYSGLVVKMENREFQVLETSPDKIVVRVGAGTNWDDFVARCTENGWAGVECLSGIPGCVGASPVQNIGAYGQEVSESIVAVEGLETATGESFSFCNEDCQFEYRNSSFKRAEQGRFLITSVTFQLRPGGPPTVRYQDLRARCQELATQSLAAVRNLVLDIRREKSMVYDRSDPNHRSAGSFFTNPIVSSGVADEIERALPQGHPFPRFPMGPSLDKLSAAWLIDQSGLRKGYRHTADAKVGLSTNHVLALTNRGGATAAELVDLCEHVRAVVRGRFGVELEPEPVFVGF
jgi:UDP-N-acetylmuramate dehydrogenase